MDLSSLPEPVIVDDAEGLAGLVRELEGEDEVAVDTEADSFFSYRDKVCLVQVSAGGTDYLVDPLADLDLAPLGKILADERITKVFHDAEYDVLILKRDFGFRFAGLFDTRVAAAVLGSQAPGLASVLEDRFGVVLDKSMQRSNWAQRPLTPKQIAYARLDTRFLVELMHEQRRELADRDRAMIVDAECRRLERLDPPSQGFDPDDFVRLKGARDLDPRQARVLRELFIERERAAHEADVPPFRVLANAALIDLARRAPRSRKELLQVHGVTQKVVARVGDRILRAVKRAGEKKPIERLPAPNRRNSGPRLDELESELHDRLKRVRKDVSEELGIESAYVLNRHVLSALAARRPDGPEALLEVDGLLDWQRDLLGDRVLREVQRFEADVRAGKLPEKRRRRPRRRS